jgi:hypothetical protein
MSSRGGPESSQGRQINVPIGLSTPKGAETIGDNVLH